MLSGANIVFVVLFAKIILGKPILKHYYLACFFSMCGFLIVGVSPIVDSLYPGWPGKTDTSYFFGTIMVFCYNACYGIQGNIQELILRQKAIDSQRMVGIEGMFGVLWSFLFIMLTSYVACPTDGICELDGPLTDPVNAIYQIRSNNRLMFYCGASIIAVLILNLVALKLVKLVSAVYRAFWSTITIIIIWVDCI